MFLLLIICNGVNAMNDSKQERKEDQKKEIEIKFLPVGKQLQVLNSWLSKQSVSCSKRDITDWYFDCPESRLRVFESVVYLVQ